MNSTTATFVETLSQLCVWLEFFSRLHTVYCPSQEDCQLLVNSLLQSLLPARC
jgi:hypothetical protein